MRKGLTFALMLVLMSAVAAPAFAFSKGTFRIGARNVFDQMTLSSDGNDQDVEIIALEGGYFVADNVEVGASYSSFNLENSRINPNLIKVMGKYYIPVGGNNVYVGGGFAQLEVADDVNGDYIFLTGGYALQVKTFFSIDFGLLLGSGDVEGTDMDVTDLSVTYSLYF